MTGLSGWNGNKRKFTYINNNNDIIIDDRDGYMWSPPPTIPTGFPPLIITQRIYEDINRRNFQSLPLRDVSQTRPSLSPSPVVSLSPSPVVSLSPSPVVSPSPSPVASSPVYQIKDKSSYLCCLTLILCILIGMFIFIMMLEMQLMINVIWKTNIKNDSRIGNV